MPFAVSRPRPAPLPVPPSRSGRWVGLWSLLIVLVAIGTSRQARAAEDVSVQLSWLHQFQFAGYYLAQERGYYRQAGLNVELRAGGPGTRSALDAVDRGHADFGITNSGLAAAYMGGKALVAVAAVLQRSPGVWLVRGNIDDISPRSLAGRRFMQPPAAEESAELLIPFIREGLNPATLRTVPMAYSIEAFLRGDADLFPVYLSNELFELDRRGLQYQLVNPSESGIELYGEVLFTSKRQAESRSSAVARFREATIKGWQAAFDDIDGTARLIQARYAPTRSLESLRFEGQRLKALAEFPQVEVGHTSARRWVAIGQQYAQAGFNQRPLVLDDFLFDRLVARHPKWPDPVRITLVGMVAVLLLSAWRLLRVNQRLATEVDLARDRGRSQRAQELRFQFLTDVAPFPLLIYALDDGAVVYANERALGWRAHDGDDHRSQVQHWLPPLGPDTPAMALLHEGRLLRDLEIELPGSHAGPSRWCLTTVRAIEYEGRACGFATFSDISSRKNAELELALLSEQRRCILAEVEQLQRRMREASLRDALTGLFNRGYYDTTIVRELARAQREGTSLALMVIDADHFKHINDRYGHAGGDEVLRKLGALLQAAHRSGDIACRYGGEEFVVVLPGADAEAAVSRAEALRQRVQALETACDTGIIRFTVSIGVAVTTGRPVDDSALFQRADQAAYLAKQQGRNRVVLAPSPTSVLRVAPAIGIDRAPA